MGKLCSGFAPAEEEVLYSSTWAPAASPLVEVALQQVSPMKKLKATAPQAKELVQVAEHVPVQVLQVEVSLPQVPERELVPKQALAK